MKISIGQHRLWLKETFSDDELAKILAWFDRELMTGLTAWEKKQDEPEFMAWWRILVQAFNKLPDNKKAKAFIYQTLVLNNIVEDEINNKVHCPYRHKGCLIQKRWLAKLERTWQASDLQNICGNFVICLRLPSPDVNPLWLDKDDKRTFVELDDSILKK